MQTRRFALCLGLFLLAALRPAGADSYVRFNTSLGYIDVELLSNTEPNTVANFLNYVNSPSNPNNYTNSIIHRVATVAVDGVAVIQGGGFYNYSSPPDPTDEFPPAPITTNAPLTNEFNPSNSNVRGTLAMAMSDFPNTTTVDINSATSQWYFNVVDNSAGLDPLDFTVFGVIVSTSGLSVMDQISAVPTFTDGGANDGGALTEIPLLNYTLGNNVLSQNYVTIYSITPLTVQTFANWQTAKFTTQQQSMPNFIAPGATPWNDGVPNLLKYLCDINPGAPMSGTDRAKLPTVGTTTIGGTPYMTLTYHQYTALVGVTLNVQTSPDLKTWTTVTQPTFVQTNPNQSTVDPIFQVQVPVTGTSQFIRLNVTQP